MRRPDHAPDRASTTARSREVGFTGRGCAISQASASLLTDEIKGKPVAEVAAFRADDLLDLLGIDISPARLKCAMLSHDTLQHALAELRRGSATSARHEQPATSARPAGSRRRDGRRTTMTATIDRCRCRRPA